MKVLVLAALAIALPAQADFSYKVTRKNGGQMGAMAGGPTTSTYYYKGQKLKIDNGTTATILDFEARTITTVNTAAKTVTVRPFADAAAAGANNVQAQIDVKETGQRKSVNGFNASEAILTMEVDAMPGRGPANMQMGKMQMEMDMWLSGEVPGADQLYAFHQKNAANFPYSAMSGGGNPAMASAMADAMRKIAAMHGIPVQQIVRVKSAGGAGAAAPQMPQMTGAQQAQMEQARARLEAMAAQGGPAAAAAQQALSRMGGVPGATPGGASSGALIEITMDSSDFSGAAIPDSVFAIPADYQKTN